MPLADLVELRLALGTDARTVAEIPRFRPSIIYMQENITEFCGVWYTGTPIPPGWHQVTKEEWKVCNKKQAAAGGPAGAPPPGAKPTGPTPLSAAELYRRRQAERVRLKEYRELLKKRPRPARPPRSARLPRSPRPYRQGRTPRSARKPRDPRSPRTPRTPRTPRAPRPQGDPGVWYCQIDYLPFVGEVMRGPIWRGSKDPVLPYSPGKGGWLPVASPFMCHGESCGAHAAPLKKIRDALWEKFNVRPAEQQPQPPGAAPGDRPIRPRRDFVPTKLTAQEGVLIGTPTAREVPAGSFMWFATNQAAQVRTGTTGYWIAPGNDDPVARWGGVPSDYAFTNPPQTTSLPFFP
jgi:hypothetical protein